jgi:hypothetical protein
MLHSVTLSGPVAEELDQIGRNVRDGLWLGSSTNRTWRTTRSPWAWIIA